MHIIPVIDLLNGTVVHAKKGDRRNYQPIKSLLCTSSEPVAIIGALLEYYPFDELYVADLNAIQKTGTNHAAALQNIARHFPGLKLWVDAGISTAAELTFWSECNFNLILGSENFSSLDNFMQLSNQLGADFTLSLDFMPEGYKGPAELIENSDYWPENVILMSLTHVGANQGLDTALLERFKPSTRNFKIYAAGGVRNAADISTLKKMGYSGALIASALHGKQIAAAELKTISQ